jgi:hypothetical protein
MEEWSYHSFTERGWKYLVLGFGFVKFDMLIRHLSGDIE